MVPTKATKYSIGLDLYIPDSYLIHPKRQVLIPIQIKLGIPPGYYGRITSKSGLAVEHEICVGAGVIDPDYTGEIKVLLINPFNTFHVRPTWCESLPMYDPCRSDMVYPRCHVCCLYCNESLI